MSPDRHQLAPSVPPGVVGIRGLVYTNSGGLRPDRIQRPAAGTRSGGRGMSTASGQGLPQTPGRFSVAVRTFYASSPHRSLKNLHPQVLTSLAFPSFASFSIRYRPPNDSCPTSNSCPGGQRAACGGSTGGSAPLVGSLPALILRSLRECGLCVVSPQTRWLLSVGVGPGRSHGG